MRSTSNVQRSTSNIQLWISHTDGVDTNEIVKNSVLFAGPASLAAGRWRSFQLDW